MTRTNRITQTHRVTVVMPGRYRRSEKAIEMRLKRMELLPEDVELIPKSK